MTDMKKFAVGGDEPCVSGVHKKAHARHHVKRRSSGRVHVSKLTPMARGDDDQVQQQPQPQQVRPFRSQSNRSMRRLSTGEKRATATLATAAPRPLALPLDAQIQPTELTMPPAASPPSPAPTMLSPSRSTAAPVEQTLNATASALVSPVRSNFAIHPTTKKQLLRSQFIYHSATHDTAPVPANDHPYDPDHPRNALRLCHALERVEREYRHVQLYQDPMKDSLQRCVDRQEQEDALSDPRFSMDMVSKRTQSSSVIPTLSSYSPLDPHVPHLEHRQQVRRRRQGLQASTSTPARPVMLAQGTSPRWSAGAFLDRIWNGILYPDK